MLINRKIIVVGSTNMDMVVRTNHFPAAGETVLGGKFYMNLGGKGANQAVAAARLGATVQFISSVGNDIFGKDALQQFKNENIDISAVRIDQNEKTGVALITVDINAENTIVVASGANENLYFDNLTELDNHISRGSIVLMQLEIPLNTIEKICVHAKEKGATVILNPAPAQMLTPAILQSLDIITPNQHEAELLSGVKVVDIHSAELAAIKLRDLGPKSVIITMGKEGAFLLTSEEKRHFPAIKVKPIDTTAAGDVFNGALVAGLSQGISLVECIVFANRAAAIAVTRQGAQDSAPTLQEMEIFNNHS